MERTFSAGVAALAAAGIGTVVTYAFNQAGAVPLSTVPPV